MKEQIFSAIEESPGMHFRQLKRRVDCSTSTLNYHLRDQDSIRERHLGNYRRFYPLDIDERFDDSLAELNHPTRGKILYLLACSDLEKPSELAENLEIEASTVSHHLKTLKEKGLVNCGQKGRSRSYEVCGQVSEAIDEFSTCVMKETDIKEA